MNDTDKKTQELMEFLRNSSGNPMEGLVPTPPQPIENYDAMLEQGQTPPEAIVDVPAPAVAMDRASQLKQALTGISGRVSPQAPAQSNYRDDVLAQLKAAREENKSGLNTARATDSKVGLLSDMNKAFNQIGTGIANQAGYTKIVGSPLEVSSDLAKQAGADNADKLAGINEKYKIEADREKASIEADERKSDRSFKQQMLDLQRIKAQQDKKDAEGAGQKELDKQSAKEYQEWSSGGEKVAQSEIGKLKSVVQDLKKGKLDTGGLTGMFPDQLTSKDVLGARANVQSSVMGSLRQLLGAQFTEKEGERVIKNTWNEADSTENNIERLDRLVNDLENKAMDKSRKANYFQSNKGTLKGFESNFNSATKPQGDMVKVIDPSGKIRSIPKNKVQDALAAGGTLAE